MVPTSIDSLAPILAALYLRGAPRETGLLASRWPIVLRALRTHPERPSAALRDAGLWMESVVAEDAGLLRWAERQIAGSLCLTVVDPEYPARWLSVLGHRAPPAVWV
ncbi:MAG TPA: hypothetical protein VGE01_03805, partial [Fimbriimonas sp.]